MYVNGERRSSFPIGGSLVQSRLEILYIRVAERGIVTNYIVHALVLQVGITRLVVFGSTVLYCT